MHLLFLAATARMTRRRRTRTSSPWDRNAATLHHIAYGRGAQVRAAQSLLIDAGAAYQGYTSDVTRTHVSCPGAAAGLRRTGGGWSRCSSGCAVRRGSGCPTSSCTTRSHVYVADILRDLGIVRMDTDRIVETGISRLLFPHGLGHSLGLQCHDVGCAEIKPKPGNEWLAQHHRHLGGTGVLYRTGCLLHRRAVGEAARGRTREAVDWRLVDELRPLAASASRTTHVLADGIENLTRAHLAEEPVARRPFAMTVRPLIVALPASPAHGMSFQHDRPRPPMTDAERVSRRVRRTAQLRP
ncbi:MAG: M24 family metallopeptidase [Dehalococcoidia bacterium]